MHIILFVMAPAALIGAVGLWFQLRFWFPLANQLGLPRYERGKHGRLLMAGVVNASVEQEHLVRVYRQKALVFYFTACVGFGLFLGYEAFLLFGLVLCVGMIINKPLGLGKNAHKNSSTEPEQT